MKSDSCLNVTITIQLWLNQMQSDFLKYCNVIKKIKCFMFSTSDFDLLSSWIKVSRLLKYVNSCRMDCDETFRLPSGWKLISVCVRLQVQLIFNSLTSDTRTSCYYLQFDFEQMKIIVWLLSASWTEVIKSRCFMKLSAMTQTLNEHEAPTCWLISDDKHLK